MQEIAEIQKRFKNKLEKIKNPSELERIKIEFLGKKGVVNELFKSLINIPLEKRKELGGKLNNLKRKIEKEIQEKEKTLKSRKDSSFLDITLPGKKISKGTLHLVSLATEEIIEIFKPLGFIRMSYPEVEWEHYSFEALNMPKGHPARDDFETFFVKSPSHPKWGKMILSPHTSSGQVREMLRVKKPPIRMINIAKCYRPNWDTTHVPMFHQFEGLCIDRDINLTHLIGTIDYFVKSFFGKNRKIRLRPFHFQFTEPSFEFDVSCSVCGGKGYVIENGEKKKCKVCKSGWLELGGAGMVHPNVLKAGGIDPKLYSGWAFGIGIERSYMMREGLKIDDIRVLYNGDLRFLKQF